MVLTVFYMVLLRFSDETAPTVEACIVPPTELELQELNTRLKEIPSRIHRATNAGDLDLLRTVCTVYFFSRFFLFLSFYLSFFSLFLFLNDAMTFFQTIFEHFDSTIK